MLSVNIGWRTWLNTFKIWLQHENIEHKQPMHHYPFIVVTIFLISQLISVAGYTCNTIFELNSEDFNLKKKKSIFVSFSMCAVRSMIEFFYVTLLFILMFSRKLFCLFSIHRPFIIYILSIYITTCKLWHTLNWYRHVGKGQRSLSSATFMNIYLVRVCVIYYELCIMQHRWTKKWWFVYVRYFVSVLEGF